MPRALFLPKTKAAVVHEATLQVLERSGVYLDHEEAETLLLEGGAVKDEFGRVLLPRRMVEEALEKASDRVQLFDREGNRSILARNGKTYFGPGSDALYNIDSETGLLRPSVLADVKRNVTVADALGGFDFVMSMALPRDVPPHKVYASVFAEMVKNTTKPVAVTATSLDDIRQTHRIASLVVGGDEALRQKPFFLAYLELISPLKMDRSSTERLLYCAEHGIPFVYASGANCGSGAPVTPVGGLVQGSAESLSGLVLALLKNEQARFIYGSNTSVIDMTTSIVSYGAPEWFKTVAMYADMGKFFDLPSWGTAGCSDSFSIDAQAALEAYEGILLATQSGTTLAHDVGYLSHGALYDPRMLVLSDEMINRARFLMKEADLSEKSLAVDVIDEVARMNDLYLAHPHTSEVFRTSLWLPPTYINRRNIADYALGHDLAGMLGERVQGILATHTPKPLPADTLEAIDAYLDSL